MVYQFKVIYKLITRKIYWNNNLNSYLKVVFFMYIVLNSSVLCYSSIMLFITARNVYGEQRQQQRGIAWLLISEDNTYKIFLSISLFKRRNALIQLSCYICWLKKRKKNKRLHCNWKAALRSSSTWKLFKHLFVVF